MLVELAIRNFAIIERVNLAFGPGLNVLTGETGAGKSILVDALGAVLGDRVNLDMVRTGAKSAAIDATFDLSQIPNRDEVTTLLEEFQVEVEDGVLILGREIQSGGRSSARLNGRPTTAAILGQIGSLLVDIHGQSDHLSLLRPAAQLDLLDRYAQTTPTRDEFSARLGELRRTRRLLEETLSGARERMQRVDLLRYQVAEITAANLDPDEEERLDAERARLANADRLVRDAASAYDALAGDEELDGRGAAMPALRQAAHVLAELGAIDPTMDPLVERANEVLFLLEDLAGDVRAYRDDVESDPARLEAVEERLADLRQLQKKYGGDVPAILHYAREAQEELDRLTGSESDSDVLAAREVEQASEAGRLAARLSEQRADRAKTLAAQVEQAIARLNMGAAEFSVAMDRVVDPRGIPVRGSNGSVERFAADSSGIDHAEFLIAPNPGEALKPLGRIASGGETARLMLALKSVLSDVDRTPTLVFDEIDVGVGGRSGQVVGEMLWGLTAGHQVIVITHLPQIAAFADAHFRIAKTESDGRAVSIISALEQEERIEELAAMLDGVPVSPSSLQNAAEMVERAAAAKAGQGLRRRSSED
ncbi:MAG: repair protein RecN [Thermomicrobiales bacterium]|jgi:DNA repair protein RecN (Recombination protein N)|nr:repair protein RecN [Thermomicrobiales bacterium]